MPIISLLAVIASCVLGYMLQKNYKTVGIRFRGKRLDESKKMVIADVLEVYVKAGEYYAKCRVQGTWSEPTIKIDKTMMAAMPDSTSGDGKPIKQVLLYESSAEDGNVEYSLTPEEIRFKTKLKVVQEKEKTDAEIQNAMDVISLYYDIRLVLWTLAWVGVYRSPGLSIIFSVLAGIISARNIIPLRYTKIKKCGIIKTNKDGLPSKKEKSQVPPGYDNWSEESQYIYNLDQRVTAQKNSGALDCAQAPADEPEVTETVQDEYAVNLTYEPEKSGDDDTGHSTEEPEQNNEEEPFFTDEELAAETNDEDEDAIRELSDETDEADVSEEAYDAEDDEFDADGFESDSMDADSLNSGQKDNSAEEFTAVPLSTNLDVTKNGTKKMTEQRTVRAGKNKAKTKASSRHMAKKNVQEVLNTLMGDEDDDGSENIL